MSYTLTPWNKMSGTHAKRIFEYQFDGMGQLTPECHREWLKMRRVGIGGSDISALTGCNKWKSAIDVFLDKTGRQTTKENEKMKWGKILEDPVAREYGKVNGVKINRVNAMLQHPDHPHCIVNLDRMVRQNGRALPIFKHGNGVLEVKTTGWAQAWEGNEIPDMYYCQGQWECGVSGLKWCQFATLISGQELLIPKPFMFDENFFGNMVQIAEKFWMDNVLKDVVPEVDNSPAAYDAVKKLFPTSQETKKALPAKFGELIEKRKQLKELTAKAEAERKTIDAMIMKEMGTNKWGIIGKHKVTKIIKHSSRFNSKDFKEKHNDLYTEFVTPSESQYLMYGTNK